MSMLANRANLDENAVAEFLRRHPPGSRLYQQEVEGEFITEILGALWNLDLIDRLRATAHPDLTRVVVAIDPSGSADEDTGVSECGIVVAGRSTHTGHAYVLDDRSLAASPNRWAAQAVAAYHDHRADMIVAERNFGGEMVRAVIQTVDPAVPVKLVTASRGKQLRAEPVASLYERELVRHVGAFQDLEAQMCTWTPEDPVSPDRLDALVWALTELMIERGGGRQYEAYGAIDEPVYRRGDIVKVGSRYIDK